MNIWQSIVLGVVEGVTEFLPVSSTGHLTITEKLLGLDVADEAVTGYTAVIQMGAIAAVIIYFFKDIVTMVRAVFAGAVSPAARSSDDFRIGMAVLFGSLPIGIVGLAFKDVIKEDLRSLWVVAAALVLWSVAMVAAEHYGSQRRGEASITIKDGVIIGLAQCLALIPGVSRSGATISTGMLRGVDRVTAARLSFFLGIPALFGAGLYELKDALSGPSVSVASLVVGTLVSFVVAYASIAWLLRFVSHHSMTWFASYRVMLGGVLVIALGTHALAAV